MEAPVSKRNRIPNFEGNMISFLQKHVHIVDKTTYKELLYLRFQLFHMYEIQI